MTVLKRSIGLVAAAIVLSSTTFALPHTLLIRQVAAASNSSDSNSINNGGAGSAQISAQAAGSSISTGTGGDRSTPSSPEEFAQLLSGIFFGALVSREPLFARRLFVIVTLSFLADTLRRWRTCRPSMALLRELWSKGSGQGADPSHCWRRRSPLSFSGLRSRSPHLFHSCASLWRLCFSSPDW